MKFANIMRAAVVVAVMLGVWSCKTSEANYRAAYERAMSGREEGGSPIDGTVYAAQRQMELHKFVMAGDTFDVYSTRVSVTDGGGGIRENLRRYNIVVGQFKQQFNAVSMRNRLADGGYPAAFVVQTPEPYYFVILNSYSEVGAAATALKQMPAQMPVAVKSPCPFLLSVTQR